MEIENHGANCFRISYQKASLVIDDNLDDLGSKSIIKEGDIAVFTASHDQTKAKVKLTIDQPGEYEVSNISVVGVAARAHMDEPKNLSAVMYKIVLGDLKIAIVGHIYPDLSDTQLERLGTIDILIIPVGDTGYTLDSIGALKIIKKIEPKMVIPSHYAQKGIKYPVEQQALDEAIKGLAMEPKERIEKLKVKPADLAVEGTQLVILDKQ